MSFSKCLSQNDSFQIALLKWPFQNVTKICFILIQVAQISLVTKKTYLFNFNRLKADIEKQQKANPRTARAGLAVKNQKIA